MSDDIAIRVENLGKLYRIGETLFYKSLRETITDAFINFFGKLKKGSLLEKCPSKYFWALKDISFEVKKGEVMGVIGRNGAGKTTLLKILSRITIPTQGYAQVRGRISSLLEIGIGFHPELTGRDNIYFNGAILGMKKQEIQQKFDEIVAFAEIERFIDTPVKHYSSGMYVRLAFAVAAYLESDVLLVDEVLAVGDLGFQKKCLGKMDYIAGQGRTVLFISHNMSAVKELCSSAILLDQGRKIYSGPVDEVVNYYLDSSLDKLYSGEITPDMHSVTSESFSIDKVSINNNAGQSICHVKINEPLSIRLRFSVKQPVQNVRIGIGLDTILGMRIATLYHTDEGAPPFSGDVGTYEVEVNIRNPLLPNTYIINIAVLSTLGQALLDYVPEALKFDVVELSVDDYVYQGYKAALVQIKGDWGQLRRISDKPAASS
jgi:lipopolysaccharide transport system ATP-binding protein